MPAIVTHHLFGLEAYQTLAPVIGEDDALRDAFLLGNQGPDPLFCLKVLPKSVAYRSIGTLMHTNEPTGLLLSMHRHFIERPALKSQRALAAFALGFLCHYVLDATVHPLVYAQQYALCDAGIKGLDRAHEGREVHALIETEFDEYLLTTQRGQTVGSFSPHREILTCEPGALLAISAKLRPVASDVYDQNIPIAAFASSVQLYRAAQKALDSKREGLRRHIDYARMAGASYLHIQALTHTDRPLPNTPFTNSDHRSWPHPFEPGATVSTSFDDLYEKSMRMALEYVPRFARQRFDVGDCVALTARKNFYGQAAL